MPPIPNRRDVVAAALGAVAAEFAKGAANAGGQNFGHEVLRRFVNRPKVIDSVEFSFVLQHPNIKCDFQWNHSHYVEDLPTHEFAASRFKNVIPVAFPSGRMRAITSGSRATNQANRKYLNAPSALGTAPPGCNVPGIAAGTTLPFSMQYRPGHFRLRHRFDRTYKRPVWLISELSSSGIWQPKTQAGTAVDYILLTHFGKRHNAEPLSILEGLGAMATLGQPKLLRSDDAQLRKIVELMFEENAKSQRNFQAVIRVIGEPQNSMEPAPPAGVEFVTRPVFF